MVDRAAEFTIDHLSHWWSAIAPACTAEINVSIDLWDLLQRSWSRSPNLHQLPIALGQAYEAELATATAASHIRKRQGSYYTPEAIAQFMVAATLELGCRDRATVPTVLDPACGGGIFLVLVYRHLVGKYRPSRPEDFAQLLSYVFGVDIDPNAVAVTRLALGFAMIAGQRTGGAEASSRGEIPEARQDTNFASLSKTICCGNALVRSDQPDAIAISPAPLTQAQFDVVLGNPPYLDSEAMVVQLPHWRTYCREAYQTAKGNWDLFCVFIERALELCREGGWHSFVVPNKLISAAYAAEARSLLGRYQLHHLRDYSRVNAFAAAVYPIVYVVHKRRGKPNGTFCYEVMASPTQPMETRQLCSSRVSSAGGWHLASSQSWVSQLQNYPTLGDVAAVVGAASVSEAYRLQPLIRNLSREQPQPPNAFPNAFQFVNSGTIDRYRHHWGHKPLRYLGDRYQCPVVSKSALAIALPKRYQQAMSPKLVVAGLTRELECIWDESGALLAGKSTTLVLPKPEEAEHFGPVLLGLLNSALMTAYVKAIFGGNALQGGYLRIGPPQMRSLPLPRLAERTASVSEQFRRLVRQRQGLSHAADTMAQLDAAIDRVVCELYGVSWRDIENL